jgi:serine/threonine protein kinase
MLSLNTVLQSRYVIVGQLGRGGMGAVYEAIDQRLSRTVALKETLVETAELRRAFEREARLLANLSHPSLPRVLDHFSEDAGQYLVMDYVPGNDLKALLEKQGHPFPVDEVMRWASELLDALEYLHTHEPPVIHRDIKPSNLKLTAKGRIVLLDFGLAKGSAGQMTLATLSHSILGYSPHFAPLEQIQGDKTTPRSDLYALAATLYNLLTNRLPPDALTRATALLNDETDPLQHLNAINQKVPTIFASVLTQALAQRSSQRPASAGEMRAAMSSAQPVYSITSSLNDEITAVRSLSENADLVRPLESSNEEKVLTASSPLVSAREPSLGNPKLGSRRVKSFVLLFGGILVAGLSVLAAMFLSSGLAGTNNGGASPTPANLPSAATDVQRLNGPQNAVLRSKSMTEEQTNNNEVRSADKSAETEKSNDLREVRKYADRYPYDMLKGVPNIDRRLRLLVGKDYKKFMERFATQMPLFVESGVIVGEACAAHFCTLEMSALAINLSDGTLHCAFMTSNYDLYQTPRVRTFSEDKKSLPVALTQVINRWRENR